VECAFDEECFKSLKELSPKHSTNGWNGKIKGILADNKTFMVYRQAPAGYNTM
jgi:hypothetical protein